MHTNFFFYSFHLKVLDTLLPNLLFTRKQGNCVVFFIYILNLIPNFESRINVIKYVRYLPTFYLPVRIVTINKKNIHISVSNLKFVVNINKKNTKTKDEGWKPYEMFTSYLDICMC